MRPTKKVKQRIEELRIGDIIEFKGGVKAIICKKLNLGHFNCSTELVPVLLSYISGELFCHLADWFLLDFNNGAWKLIARKDEYNMYIVKVK